MSCCKDFIGQTGQDQFKSYPVFNKQALGRTDSVIRSSIPPYKYMIAGAVTVAESLKSSKLLGPTVHLPAASAYNRSC